MIRDVNGRYRPIKHIGHGTFGDVYKGEDIHTGENVAIKVAKCNRRYHDNEFAVLSDLGGCDGVPTILHASHGKPDGTVLVMPFLGASVAKITKAKQGSLTLPEVVFIARGVLNALECIHAKGYVHCDIKHANIVVCNTTGSDITTGKVFVVDYGLAGRYIDADTEDHISPQRANRKGTPRFASIHVHNQEAYTRRDDLHSLFYMMVLLLEGELPWTWKESAKSLEDKNAMWEHIKQCKGRITVDELTIDWSMDLTTFGDYCMGMSFAEKPDYEYLHELLDNMIKDE